MEFKLILPNNKKSVFKVKDSFRNTSLTMQCLSHETNNTGMSYIEECAAKI